MVTVSDFNVRPVSLMEDFPSERCRVDELPADPDAVTDAFGFSNFRIKTPMLPHR